MSYCDNEEEKQLVTNIKKENKMNTNMIESEVILFVDNREKRN